MRSPTPAAYFEGAALIGGRPAYIIAREMRRVLDRERQINGGGLVPDDLALALDALERAGAVWLGVQKAAEAAEVRREPVTAAVVDCSPADVGPPMSTQEVASLLGVSDRRVRQLVDSFELPARRGVGRHWAFDPALVNELLRKRNR
jgi:excisionase family DNA binding protein